MQEKYSTRSVVVQSGAIVTEGKYRYMISCKRYRIVYQIDGNNVYVDDIQDCRQDDDKRII